MKKNGIINRGLLKGIGEIGHTDMIFICDAGFPIPKDSLCIDLSIVKGFPTIDVVLEALLGEVVVEEYFVHDLMKKVNLECYEYVKSCLDRQEGNEVAFGILKEKANQAKMMIRTGDIRPCSNLVLVAASGVPEMVRKYELDRRK